MNVAEYQQRHISDRDIDLGKSPKRASKSKEFDEIHATPLTSNQATPPRRVKPTPAVISPERDFEYRHKPTVTNPGLNYVSPLKPKEPNMKYSLGNGLLEKNTSARLEKENFDHQEKMPSSKTAGDRFPPSGRKSSSNVISNSKKKLLSSSSSSRRKQDPNSYKIFLLLLQPKLKTFELIQLIYSPNDTTIGDIIAMIPENATESALGSQTYTGLCRPKTEEEIVDHELLASEPLRANTSVASAKITLGEILVAIPVEYNGADVAVLAKQILSNPKIVKLLKRSDPLAPKKRRRSSRRLGKGARRSRSKEHVEVMEKFDEEDEIKQEEEKKDSEQKMREAMEHAAQEAAVSNALIPGGTVPNLPKTIERNVSRSTSIVSLEESIGDDKTMESSLQESIDESYSSWSKSFDESFASSVCSGVSKRSVRRRDRHSRRSKIIQRSAVAGFVVMLAMYFMDPHGYSRTDEEKQVSQAATTENPMGLTGIFQCLFLLLSLYQLELFVRTTAIPSDRFDHNENNGEGQSSFLKFIQSTRAMKKLKSRFYKKLKKPSIRTRRGAVGAYDYDEKNLTQKLRSFQLKGRNNSMRSNSLDECDTGSL